MSGQNSDGAITPLSAAMLPILGKLTLFKFRQSDSNSRRKEVELCVKQKELVNSEPLFPVQ